MNGLKSWLFLLLIVIFVSVSFFKLGSLTLFDVDEAVFSEATKEMVRSGDWITPTYNGVIRYDKPILFYWLMAASYKLFGINEFAARFPSAVSGLFLCLAIFLLIRRIDGKEKAFYASISLVSSIYFFVYSHAAVTDMTLTLFITLSILFFFLAVSESAGQKITGWTLQGFYLFSSLAFLTKGLIGIIFPFTVAGIYMAVTEGLPGIRRAISLRGIVLFFVVSAPWYTAEYAVNGREFIEQFFIKHHFIRYTGVISGHKGPVYYYLPVLIIGLLPWIAFLPAGAKNALRDIRSLRGPRTIVSLQDVPAPLPKAHSLDLLAGIWLAFIVVFFSFSTTKLPNYILPSVPAASILIASGMSAQAPGWRRYAHWGISVIFILAGIAFAVSPAYLLKAGFHQTGWTLPAALLMFAVSALGLYTVFTKKTVYPYIAGLMLTFIFALSTTVLPLANEQLQGTLHRYSLMAKERFGSGERLVTYRINKPSIVFYSDNTVINANTMDELMSILKREGQLLIIANSDDIGPLTGSGLALLEKDNKYALFEKK